MEKKIKIAVVACACIFFSAGGIYLGYINMVSVEYDDELEVRAASMITEYINNDEEQEEINPARINSQTRIRYEHYDTNSGEVQILESVAPNFMIRKNLQDMEQTFNEWNIVSFTDEEVVMRRYVENRRQRLYTLGIDGDFIAIFQGTNINANLREVTSIYIGRLPQEEIERLKEGIPVYDQDELIRRLEDYSS